jgi:hypothetical protein
LKTTTLEVLATLAKPMSVAAICTSSALPDIEVCRLLWVFRCLGWIEQVEESQLEAAAPLTTAEPAIEASMVESGTGAEETPFKKDRARASARDQASIPTIMTPVSSLPIPLVEPEPDPAVEVPAEDSGASLADLPGESFDIGDGEQPIELESSPEILFEAQHPMVEPDDAPDLSVPETSSEPAPPKGSVDPDLVLETPGDAPAEPAPQPTANEGSKTKIEADDDMDMDIEGLGMVLGKNGEE